MSFKALNYGNWAESRMDSESSYQVIVLHEGHSKMIGENMVANCTCTLIKGNKNIIVDTMTPWDKDKIVQSLKQHHVLPSDINYVISTHGHSDHCGNNNLFLNAIHIMGFSISNKEVYQCHPFEDGVPFIIDNQVMVVPTPGHTLAHVSVLVKNRDNDLVAVAGDLFENEMDLTDDKVWKEAGSEDEAKQVESRQKILDIAQWIIPGHGKMFKVEKIFLKNV